MIFALSCLKKVNFFLFYVITPLFIYLSEKAEIFFWLNLFSSKAVCIWVCVYSFNQIVFFFYKLGFIKMLLTLICWIPDR